MGVRVSEREGVCLVALDRPPVNAIDLELIGEAGEAIRSAADPVYRALVVTGVPGVFSAGLDLRRVPTYGLAERQSALRAVNRLMLDLYGLPKPTVAAISGHAIAAGLVLALACDLRLAARGAFKLGLTEVNVGIPFPAGPLAVVRAELPPASLRYLNLSGALVPPDSPLLGGAIDRLVEPERLLDEAVAAARERAEAPVYARIKQQLRSQTLETLRRIVAEDAEPLLEHWIGEPTRDS